MTHIVWLWPHADRTFRFAREVTLSIPVVGDDFRRDAHTLIPGCAVIAYEVDGDTLGRLWFVETPRYDGIEWPTTLPDHRIIDPTSIHASEPTREFRPLKVPHLLPRPLATPPTRIELRWGQYLQKHKPRTVMPRGRIRRYLDDLRMRFKAWRRKQ